MWRKQDASPRQEPNPPKQSASPRVSPVAILRRQIPVPAGHTTGQLTIKGRITGRDDLLIDGQVQGKIRIENGKVSIGPSGRVTVDVEAREIVVNGQIKGNLHGHERVQFGSMGRVVGEVRAQRVQVDDGAEIRVNVEVLREQEQFPMRPSSAKRHHETTPPALVQAKESFTGA